MNLKLLNNIYINNKENLVHNFNKCGYEYRIYMQNDIITIEKEEIKTQMYEIKSYILK